MMAVACDRLLGRVRGTRPGAVLLVVAGLHGNEPAGIEAALRVSRRLGSAPPGLRGEFVALAGNLQALRCGRRFVDLDLNRQWSPPRVEGLRASATGPVAAAEDREQIELLRVLGEVVPDAGSLAYFLDLHTSSADGCPFLTVGDTLRNRAFAARFSLPMILGLEEQIDGALLEYLNNLGHVTMGVEAGRHDSPAAVEFLESVLWQAIVAAGLIDAGDAPDLGGHRARLAAAVRGVPRVVEVRFRHPVAPGDGFRMEPGFTNFRPVRRGAVLARDRAGEIRAPHDGLVLLPLYQGQGDDGFFLAREVQPAWLWVSAVLRRLRLGVLLRWLPGIRRYPAGQGALLVDTRVARFFPMEILHLLGYRKLRRHGRYLMVERRAFDLDRPRPRGR